MHHKRHRHPARRAGCKLCKPQKSVTGYKGKVHKEVLRSGGFGKIRADVHSQEDMRCVKL